MPFGAKRQENSGVGKTETRRPESVAARLVASVSSRRRVKPREKVLLLLDSQLHQVL